MSDSFVYSIRSVIFFWGTILLISDHILKKLHKPMKEQLKKKETILLLIIHLTYLIAVLLYLSHFILCCNPCWQKIFEHSALERTTK